MNQFPIVYAAINNDLMIREKSSSGGIFYLLANYVITKNGVVFGAKYDSNWEVVHDYAEDIEHCKDFMGSKYVQSKMGDNYIKVKNFLEQGKLVLFSGTPCQVQGLKAFLNKDYTNLVTVDFICHGVPSRLVWRNYLKLRKNNRIIKSINFRDKSTGWLTYSLRIKFKDGNFYNKIYYHDLYMKGFLQDIFLRPSCYECYFKGIKRNVDITLGDLWGCQQLTPTLFDNKGTSLILIQSKYGQNIWNNITSNLKTLKINSNEYQKYNPSINMSVRKSKKREIFYNSISFTQLNKLTKLSLHAYLLKKIKDTLNV